MDRLKIIIQGKILIEKEKMMYYFNFRIMEFLLEEGMLIKSKLVLFMECQRTSDREVPENQDQVSKL
jgi:hypothetical protein